MIRRDVFQAIADPVRREIISVISGGNYTLNAVAEKFDISRPAISKHVKILTECGLIVIRQKGRERYCEPQLQKLNDVSQWVEQYKVFWTKKLDALGIFLGTEVQAGAAGAIVKKSAPVKSKNQPAKKAARKKNTNNKNTKTK